MRVCPSVRLIRSSIHVKPFPNKCAPMAGARALLRENARAAGGLDWLRRSFLRRVAGARADPEVGARVASLNGNADPEVGARPSGKPEWQY